MLRSEVAFASYFSYVSGDDGRRLYPSYRHFVYPVLKEDRIVPGHDVPASVFVANEIASRLDSLPFGSFFGPDTYLVPAPSHAKKREGDLRVTKNLVDVMAALGLGTVLDCIERREAVLKAAFAGSDRPTAQRHFETIRVNRTVHVPARIVIVDDVVTRGATLLACASKVVEVWPDASVVGFAAVRTISQPHEFVGFRDPRKGVIRLFDESTFRDP